MLDPALTCSVPAGATACTGIDALSHATEAYISLYASSFPQDAALAPEAAKLIFANLERAHAVPDDMTARENLQEAAYLAGRSFSRISTGYIHAIAHRLGEYYHVPHGLAIAAAFTPVLRATLPYGGEKLAELARRRGVGETAEDYLAAVDGLIARLGLSPAESIPFDPAHAPEMARKAQEEAKLIGYPRPFSDKETEEIILRIFHRA